MSLTREEWDEKLDSLYGLLIRRDAEVAMAALFGERPAPESLVLKGDGIYPETTWSVSSEQVNIRSHPSPGHSHVNLLRRNDIEDVIDFLKGVIDD